MQRQGWERFIIPQGCRYQSPGEPVEAEAVGQYFIAAGALAAPRIHEPCVEGVGAASIQGDIRFIDAAQAMGAGHQRPQLAGNPPWRPALKAIELDCNHIPDAAMTLAVMACTPKAPPSDQHRQLAREGNRPHRGQMATELPPNWARPWSKGRLIGHAATGTWQHGSIHTYDDHRMPQFSLAAQSAGVEGAGPDHPVK